METESSELVLGKSNKVWTDGEKSRETLPRVEIAGLNVGACL